MKKEIPDISIIVPVYNVEACIERCAKSLFEQTLDNLEYIFVNDCTPDKSLEILYQMLALYPNRVSQLKIVNHETNRGIAAVRNTGLQHATGKYIGWVDSDDWVETAMFKQLYSVAEESHSDIVWCDFYYICTDYKARLSQYCKENRIDFIKSLLTGTIHGTLCCSIARKELYVKNNIQFPEGQNVVEDKLIQIKLLYFAGKIKYVPEAYYYYVKDNSTSITAKWGEYTSVQEAALANLYAIFEFLNNTDLKFELQKFMQYAKLAFKKDLLNTLEIKSFKKWRELFSETGKYVLSCPNMTLRQKVLGWSIDHEWWIVVKSWIFVKKRMRGCFKSQKT